MVAGNLRRIRRERGFSQEDLATDADVNRTYISKLEKGSTWVGLEVLVKISKVLQVEPADFLQRPVRKPAKKA